MKQYRLRVLVYGAIGLLVVGVGFVPGFFWGDKQTAAHAREVQWRDDESLSSSSSRLQELPAASSSAAARLLADPTTPEYVSEIYAHLNDAVNITRNSTAAFLQELQRWQVATQPNTALDVEPFIAVARDMLGYFRRRYSEALLLLLRHYSTSGVLDITAVNPDVLQQEIKKLLNTSNLNSYYAAVSSGCGHELDLTAAGLDETAAAAADDGTGVTQVRMTGRRLRQQQLLSLPGARRNQRHFHSTRAAFVPSLRSTQSALPYSGVTPLNSTVAAAAESAFAKHPEGLRSQISQTRHLQQQQQQQGSISGTLQDTLCLVPDAYWPTDGPTDINFVCATLPQRPYPAGFKPVEVPVVFHCLRFPSADGKLLPAVESPDEAGQSLISVANQHFDKSGFRFKLQEVRTDISKYPYLLLRSIAEWQECSVNNNDPQLQNKGLECLARVAAHPSLVTLASQLVINVIVSSSPLKPYCFGEQDITCNHTILGYVEADGPWFNANTAKPDYQEGESTKNWAWVRFTQFDVTGNNKANAWDGGGNTLAHELGHYLALMHVHEDGCNATLPGKGDGVLDTAISRMLSDVDDADPQDLHRLLQTWCTQFRDGAQPLVKGLKEFNSCPLPRHGHGHAADAAIDNIFNLMAYVPEACYMGALTPGQIDRLQSMVARHRPRMMDAFKAA